MRTCNSHATERLSHQHLGTFETEAWQSRDEIKSAALVVHSLPPLLPLATIAGNFDATIGLCNPGALFQ